jgi:hypothetical protein
MSYDPKGDMDINTPLKKNVFLTVRSGSACYFDVLNKIPETTDIK